MAQTFVLRGNSLNAYRSISGGQAGLWYPSGYVPQVVSDANAIGGQAISLNSGSISSQYLNYEGAKNISQNQAMTILISFRMFETTPSTNTALYNCGSERQSNFLGPSVQIDGNGSFRTSFYVMDGSDALNSWSNFPNTTFTLNQYNDYVVKYSGQTGEAVESFFNGTKYFAAKNFDESNVNIADWTQASTITIGGAINRQFTRINVQEFIIWDELLTDDFIETNLTGPTRNSYVAATEFDGTVQPEIADVRSGIEYGNNNGVPLEGTLNLTTGENIRFGVTQDNGNITGLVRVPNANQVQLGVPVDVDETGTLDVNNITGAPLTGTLSSNELTGVLS